LTATRNQLIQTLLRLGDDNPNFRIVPSYESDLLLEQRIVDAKYYGIASEEKLKKTYRARVWLDEAQREVKYQAILADESRSIGVFPAPKLELEKSVIRGKVLFKKEKGIAFGFKKPFDPTSFEKAYDYSFDVGKIRAPIKRAVEDAGWKFNQIILGE